MALVAYGYWQHLSPPRTPAAGKTNASLLAFTRGQTEVWLEFLSKADARFRRVHSLVLASSGGGKAARSQADAAVAEFTAKLNTAIAQGTGQLKQRGMDRSQAPPDVNHLLSALEHYKSAGDLLSRYLESKVRSELVLAGAAHASARSETNALRTIAGLPPATADPNSAGPAGTASPTGRQ